MAALLAACSSVGRFPPLWTAEVTPNCFIVRDANGQQLAYAMGGQVLTRDEARPRAVLIWHTWYRNREADQRVGQCVGMLHWEIESGRGENRCN